MYSLYCFPYYYPGGNEIITNNEDILQIMSSFIFEVIMRLELVKKRQQNKKWNKPCIFGKTQNP